MKLVRIKNKEGTDSSSEDELVVATRNKTMDVDANANEGINRSPPATVRQWLQHCIEVETTFPYVNKSQAEHDAALEAVIQDPHNNVNNIQDVRVVVSVLEDDAAFDFDSVHHMPLPIQVETYPLVIMMMYKRNEHNKCFVRVKVDLTVHDGVTGLHAGFNMLEYLETNTCSPFPHSGKNLMPTPERQQKKFEEQMARLEEDKRQGRWDSCILPLSGEGIVRPALRFTEVTVPYKTIKEKMEQARQLLGKPFFAHTVNFSPSVAVALCPTLDCARDKQTFANHITFPPVGTGPPPPMDENHVAALINTLFYNNYGKHNPSCMSGKVVGYAWDWTGFCTDFTPCFVVIQIQGKLFFAFSASPADFEVLTKSGIFDESVGKSQTFVHRPCYQPGL